MSQLKGLGVGMAELIIVSMTLSSSLPYLVYYVINEALNLVLDGCGMMIFES